MVKKLPYKDFLKSFKFAPRLSVELLVENDQSELLLIERDTPPFEGFWHLPGGFLLKGELIKDCISRLVKEEVGSKVISIKETNLGLFETIGKDPRGHILHYPVRVTVSKPSVRGKYFKKLPRKIIFYQKEFLHKLGYKR